MHANTYRAHGMPHRYTYITKPRHRSNIAKDIMSVNADGSSLGDICKRMCSLIQVRTNTTFQHVRHIKAHIFTSFYNAYIVLITHISLACHKSICYLAPLNSKLALWTKCPCGYKWNSFGCKASNEPVISAVCSSCLRQYVKIFRMFLF